MEQKIPDFASLIRATCWFADPKGDRVAIGMTGKFLPFKYYGAKGNELAVGLKEE